jgi:glyoxylase-like metal-dependent hydrolase (beta-lactamase superfamily II)
MTSLPTIERFTSSNGARIYRIPTEAFPGLIVHCYIVLETGVPTLVDCGSGYGSSNEQLLEGIACLKTDFSESITVKDIQRIIVSHGHIDHFGGTAFMAEQTGARIGIHQIDRRVLTNYEERVIVATKDLRVYLQRAGVGTELSERIIEMYGFSKKHVRSVSVDFDLDEDTPLDGMCFIHTPGHCPGQVCILLGDVLLSADHILARITPHQSPESITRYTGLGHYFESLRKVAKVDGIRLALGGHEEPVQEVYRRVEDIRASHGRKLERVLEAIKGNAPCTISDISKIMYPDRHGYDILLAIEEVGAHVEYLYEHGQLAVSNLDEIEREPNPALRYEVI